MSNKKRIKKPKSKAPTTGANSCATEYQRFGKTNHKRDFYTTNNKVNQYVLARQK